MSINFRLYNHGTAEIMNANDLKVGQTLIRLVRPTSRWGEVSGQFRTSSYTIKAILKTRLVLVSVPAEGEREHEVRLLLESGKYSTWRSGEVKTDREGTSNSWNRDAYEFATEDEPMIEELRAYYAAQAQEQADRHVAKEAVENVRQSLSGSPSLDKVEAAIQALQVLADSLRAQA